jgi:hypothetical protein
LLDSTLTFEGNIISGSSVPQTGTQITIAQDYYGGTALNSTGLIVADNAESSGVQNGWIIRFYDGTIRTVTGNYVPSGQPFRTIAFGSSVSLNPGYPLTIESPNYQLGSDAFVELKVGNNRWTFDTGGSLNTPGNMNVTGSVNISNVMKLTPVTTFPSGQAGMLVASASYGKTNLYMYDGSNWKWLVTGSIV